MSKRAGIVALVLVVSLLALPVWAGGQKDTGAAGGTTVAKVGKYNEAPDLAAKVKAGQLPPVEQRLPEAQDLFVATPIEKVGTYGGTINVFALDNLPWNDFQWGTGLSDGLFRMNKEATGLEPNLAKGYELSPDAKSFTIFLRRGVKWSDGVPLTADDVVFWFEDMVKDPQIETWNPLPATFLRAVKVDDYTVRMEFSEPHPALLSQMAQWPSWDMFMPKHYLSKWHIKYNPDADKLAASEGFKTWRDAFKSHYWWAPQTDFNLPKINAWVETQATTSNLVFERNPYYWKVDTAGNQLPYIDKVQVSIVDQETYNLKIISGEADYAYIKTSFENYTLYKESESKGRFRTILMPGAFASNVSIGLNQTYPDATLRKLFQDVRFRQALSVAINRQEINNVLYFGKGTPRQATVLPSASYYKKEWGTSYAQYDVAMANRLLDQVGLTRKDNDGFRLAPDGKPLNLVIEYSIEAAVDKKVMEMVKEYWEKVGIRTTLTYQDINLFREKEALNTHMARAGMTTFSDEMSNWTQGNRIYATHGDIINFASIWDRWQDATANIKAVQAKLAASPSDDEKAKLQDSLKTYQTALAAAAKELPDGKNPPADYLSLNDWFTQRNMEVIGSAKYKDLSQKIYDWHMKNLWLIGTVGMVPQPLIASNRLHNVITPDYINRAVLPYDVTDYFFQYYLDK